MTRRYLLFFGLALILAFTMGCNAPQYQPCCVYDNATQEVDPVCYAGENPDTGQPWVWELVGECDEEAWACEIYTLDDEGNPTGETMDVPICPKMDEIKCNTTCVGIFCGSFRFDPRPNSGALGPQSSYKSEYDMELTRDDEDIPPKPMGLWNAECRVQNITPRFMRYVENSGSVVLNTFRFGIGNSFQDFESAQPYFPLVDEACGLNVAGPVERFYLYAIPNQEHSGGELCNFGGAISPNVWFNEQKGEYMEYVCNDNRKIYSMNYFDCASRCVLEKFNYPAEIDPHDPYPTYSNNCESGSSSLCAKNWGNPFAYGLDKNEFSGDHRYDGMFADLDTGLPNFDDPYGVPADELAYRGTVETLSGLGVVENSVYIDDYPYGTTLYGATFGMDPPLTTHHPFLWELARTTIEYETTGEDGTSGSKTPKVISSLIEDYYSLNNYTNNISDYGDSKYNLKYVWKRGVSISGPGAGAIQTIFTTVENDPRPMYSWLLSHHSVYNEQFLRGHYTLNGTHEEGAEFECDEPTDCKSNYCNNFEYRRAACIDADSGEDVLCDCEVAAGGVVCRGTKEYTIPSWDNPDEDVTLSRALPAPVSKYEEPEDVDYDLAKEMAILPSLGTIEMLPASTSDLGNTVGGVPIFVMHLGGAAPNSYWYDGSPLPSYQVVHQEYMTKAQTWTDDDGCAFFRYALNPTSAGITRDDACWALDYYTAAKWSTTGHWDYFNSFGTIITPSTTDIVYDYATSCYSKHKVTTDSATHEHDPWDINDAQHLATDDSPCTDADYEDQRNRYLTRFVDECLGGPEGEYSAFASVCISRNAQMAYGLRHYISSAHGYEEIDGWSHTAQTYSYAGVTVPDGMQSEQQICSYIRKLAEPGEENDYPNLEAYEKIVCYEWDNGQRKYVGGNCVSEALSFLVVAPRVVIEGPYAGRLAIGKCLLNEEGDDFELHQYGICESCGYLTLAKEHLVALPENNREPEGLGDGGDLPWNMYCPDTVVHTPQPMYSLLDTSLSSTNDHSLYNWRYLLMGPWEYGGFTGLEQGNMNLGFMSGDIGACMLPNGVPLVDEGMGPSGLPYITPNAFYVNRKLETFMKRNIQPVLFADDPGLWVAEHDDDLQGDNNFDPKVLVLGAGHSTSHLMSVMFKQRPDLFSVFAPDKESQGSFLGNTLLNEGPIVLVVKVANNEDTNQSVIIERGRATRLLCPNCAISVAFGYEGDHTDRLHGMPQMAQIATMFNYTSTTSGSIIFDPNVEFSCTDPDVTEVECDEDMLKFIDIISVKIVLQDGDFYCGISNKDERFAMILAALSDIGVNSLKRYDTPVLITDLIIDRSGSCWDEKEAGELLTYIGMNRQLLAKSGVTGIIYGDWESTETDATGIRFDEKNNIAAYRGEFYEGVYSAARNFAGYEFQMYYNEIPVMEFCPCVPCGVTDSPAICNGHFMGDTNAPVCGGGYGGGYCFEDSDCPDGYECKGNQCQLPECDTDEDCDEGEACDGGACVEAACIGVDCPAGEYCEGGECIEEELLIAGVLPRDTLLKVGPDESGPSDISGTMDTGTIYVQGSQAPGFEGIKGGIPPINEEGYIPGTSMKWQDNCITKEACLPPGSFDEATILCTIHYNNGTTDIVSFEGSVISQNIAVYRDVIASIDAPQIPCFPMGDKEITYRKMMDFTHSATPLAFQMDGNLSISCDPSEAPSEFCGYSPPTSDVLMHCEMSFASGSAPWEIQDQPTALSFCDTDDDCFNSGEFCFPDGFCHPAEGYQCMVMAGPGDWVLPPFCPVGYGCGSDNKCHAFAIPD